MAAHTPFRLRWPHLLLAAFAYLVLLLAWTPASVLSWALPRASGQAAWLEQAQGSMWRGGGVLRLEIAGESTPLGHLDWRWRPLDLFSGRLGYELRLGGGDAVASGTLRTGMRDTEVRDLHAEAPAALLAKLSPDLAVWQPGGRLFLDTEHLAIGTGRTDGKATLRWQDAASARVKRALGSYRAELEGTDGAVGITVSTEAGALTLQGDGDWNTARGLRFSGQAQATPESRADFEGFLRLLGPARADGSRAINIGR